MPKYYGVQRSGEYLAHYGVKGMKWGVRKAIESGNTARLGRHYAKAQAKLRRLNARADLNTVKQLKKGMGRDAVRDIATSALASGGMTYGLNSGVDKATRLKYAGAAAGLGALASGISYGVAGAQLHHLASKKGHAKAVQKRDKWQQEMNQTFKGTVYDRNRKLEKKSMLNKRQQALERQAHEASRQRDIALNERNRHLTGSFDNSKYNRAYQEADRRSQEANERFYRSMNSRQRRKYHDRYLY